MSPAMKKFILAIAITITLLPAAAQRVKKVSTHLDFIQQFTISDKTIKNNHWGMGLGLQTTILPYGKFRPTIDASGFYYFAKYKLLYVNPDDSPIPDVEHLVNLFAGVSYKPTSTLYFSLVGGPSFVSEQTLFGIKPSVGAYFSPSQKWKAQLSYLHIFNRGQEEWQVQDFTSLALSIGIRLF
jgi:hypothetical protein